MQPYESAGVAPERARDFEDISIEETVSGLPRQRTVSASELEPVRQGILHVRLRHVFCTLEELFDASLRDQPFVVGTGAGRPGEPGRVIDASAAAVRQGVIPGMSLRRAYRLAPKMRFLPATFERYQPSLQRLGERYRAYSRIVETLAPADSFIDLQGCELSFPSPVALAQRLSAEIAEMGLTALMGIASGKALAELAALVSRKEGRAGVCAVPPGAEATFVQGLPLSLLVYTRTAMSSLSQSTFPLGEREEHAQSYLEAEGPGTAFDAAPLAELVAHLKDFGIITFAQVAMLTEEGLRRRLGPVGAWLFSLARGKDDSFVIPDAPPSSQNARAHFHHPADAEETCAAIQKLANYLGDRLQSQRLKGQAITLVLWPYRPSPRITLQLPHEDEDEEGTTLPTRETIGGRLTLVQQTDDADVIAHHALMLFAQYHRPALCYTQAQLRIGDMRAISQLYTPPHARSRGKLTRKLEKSQ